MADSTIKTGRDGRITVTTGPIVTSYGKGHAAAAQIALLHDAILRENAEVVRLRNKMSHRRCHDCRHVDYYVLDTLPYCVCVRCGSADTRLIHAAKAKKQGQP